MTLRVFSIFAAAVLLCVAATQNLGALKPNPTQDLKERVATLEADRDAVLERLEAMDQRLSGLEKENKNLKIKVAIQDKLAKKVFTWFRDLPAACTKLESQMALARKKGFTKAGPNPAAKSEVLNALSAFAKALNTSNPSAKPAKKP